MKKLVLSLALILGLAGAGIVNAQSTYYDYRSGNMYNSYSDQSGTTTYGYNSRTGSNWQLRQNRDGSYSGQDADGNFFSGNNNTGFYQNFGTGRTCMGTGAARTCY